MDEHEDNQTRVMIVDLDAFVPRDHLLRLIRAKVDFRFFYDKVRPLYSTRGRPSIDPVMLIKMMLIGYLYGIPSERQLEQEITMNPAYRWLLGLQLDQRVPDHSTVSQNRRRCFAGTAVFEEVFAGIVEQCKAAGLVGGEAVVTDSTHMKANASSSRTLTTTVTNSPRQYLQELDAQVEAQNNEHRERRGGGGKRGPSPGPRERSRVVTVSRTDPGPGLLNRPGKPSGFHYLNHMTLDVTNGIIMDVHVTAGNVNDHEPYVERLRHLQRSGLSFSAAAADKGYDYPAIHKHLHGMGITSYIPPANRRTEAQTLTDQGFQYDPERDAYQCANGCWLRFTHVQTYKRQRIYAARRADCRTCPLRAQCLPPTGLYRRLKRTSNLDATAAAAVNLKRLASMLHTVVPDIWSKMVFSH